MIPKELIISLKLLMLHCIQGIHSILISGNYLIWKWLVSQIVLHFGKYLETQVVFHFSVCSGIQPMSTVETTATKKKEKKKEQQKSTHKFKIQRPIQCPKQNMDSTETDLLKNNAKRFHLKWWKIFLGILLSNIPWLCWSLKFTPTKKPHSIKVSSRFQCTHERSTPLS